MPRGNGGGLPVGRRRRPGRPTSGAPGTAGPALPAGTRRAGIPPCSHPPPNPPASPHPRPPANPGHPTRPLAGNRMGLTVIPGQCPPRRHGDVHRDSSEVPRAFRTVHPLGWTIWKGEVIAPTEEELLAGIQGRSREDGDRDLAPDRPSG